MTAFILMLTFEGDPSNQNDWRLFPFTRNFKLSVKLRSRVRLCKTFKFSHKLSHTDNFKQHYLVKAVLLVK